MSINIDSSRLQVRSRTILNVVNKELRNAQDSMGAVGAESVRQTIKTRGTDFSSVRSGFGLGSSGRVRTGKMLSSVGVKREGNVLKFGMALAREAYFYYQEYGFRNVWKFVSFGRGTYGPNAPGGFRFRYDPANAKTTEGMHSLRDAIQDVKDKMPSITRNAEQNIQKGVGNR